MGGLFGKRSQSTTPVRLNSIQISQSAYGNCVPLLYGTNRLPVTLIDYVDFKAQSVSQSAGGKGGSQTTQSYSYSASIVGALCEGPIPGITTVFLNQSVTTLAAQNLVLFTGAGSQPVWSYMSQFHPDHAIPYDHTAYVAGANYSLGSQAGLPNLTFEVQGLQIFDALDAHPALVIPDYCTDPNHGAGFPFLAPLGGGNSFMSYCTAMGFLVSPCETTQRAASDFLGEMLQITNSDAVWSPAVGLRIVPYADQAVTGNGASFTPNLAPIYSLNDKDYVYQSGQAPVVRSIVPANQTYNCWRVEFLDRSNQYNTAIEEYRDEVDVSQNGLRVAPTVTLHSITKRPVAKMVATLLCLRNLYIRSTFVFMLRADYSLVEPMDLLALNDSIGGIVNQLVRITQVQDDGNDNLTITAEEMMVGPASAPIYDIQLAQAFAANYEADPGPVSPPYILTAPPLLANNGAGGYEMWVAVAGTSGEWGGADVWASLDNITYQHVGIVTSPARYGVLQSALLAGNDPDTSNVLNVQINANVPATLVSATRAAADNLRSLAVVDGEVISYQNVTPAGDNAYAISYLRRGQYDSADALHNAGTFFTVVDGALFRMPFDPGMAGQPIWFKFVSFNFLGGGREDISAQPAYLGFMQGQNSGQLLAPGASPLLARGNCINVGTRIYKQPTAAAAWDSDCYSADSFTGGCALRFRAAQTNAAVMMGLSVNPKEDENFSSLDYAWLANSDGIAYVYKGGQPVAATTAYSPADTFEIRYDGKFVTFFLTGVQWFTDPAPGNAFSFDSSFFTPGAAVSDVFFGALNPANTSPFIARGNCTVSDESAQKAGGVPGWDSDVYSLEGFPSCHVSFKANANTFDMIVGLGLAPASDMSFGNINWAFNCIANGTWRILEDGAVPFGATGGTYTAATVFAITFDLNHIVRWFVDNVQVFSQNVAGQRVVYMDSSFFTPGAGVNTLQFGATSSLQLADTSQLAPNAASQIVSASLATSTTVNYPVGGTTINTDMTTAVLNSTGLPAAVDATVDFQLHSSNNNTIQGCIITLRRDGADIGTASFDAHAAYALNGTFSWAGPVTLTITDNPPAGAHTYAFHVVGRAGGTVGNPGITYTNPTIKIREYKR